MAFSARTIDWLLFNLAELRHLIDGMQPRTSDIIQLGVRRTRGSQVERVAIERARLSAVVGTVEGVLAVLSPEERRIVRMKYREGQRHRAICRAVHLSEATLKRRLERIRLRVWTALANVDPARYGDFWRKLNELARAE